MKTQTTPVVLLVTLFAACFVGMVAQAQSTKTDPVFETIKPLLKENTYLVAHVDLAALDIDALAEKFRPQMLEGAETAVQFGAKLQGKENDEAFLAESRKQAEQMIDEEIAKTKVMVQSVLDAGVEDLFFFAMTETMQTFPLVLAIPGEPELDESVTAMLAAGGFLKAGVADGMTFFVNRALAMMPPGLGGAPSTALQASQPEPARFMAVLKRAKAKPRKEFNDALYLQRKSPIRVVFAPTLGMKGMAQMFLPSLLSNLPPEMKIDPKSLGSMVKDFVSLSVGVNLETGKFNIAAEFPSEQSAAAAGAFLTGLASGIEDENMQKIIKPFLPKPIKQRLILVVKEEQLKEWAEAGPMRPVMMTPMNSPTPATE